ncbi:MAG: lysostaphin resistance A-like protein [Candidatus Omnitrophota bacterium]
MTGFLRKNAAALAMVFFVVSFYSLLYFSHRAAEKETPAGGVKKTERLSSEDLKRKEEKFKKNIQAKPEVMAAVSLGFLAVLAAGFVTDLTVLIQKSRGAFSIPRTRDHTDVPWGLQEVLFIYAFLFFAEAVIVFCEILAGAVFHLTFVEKDLFLMLNSLLRDVFVAGIVVLLVTRKFRVPLSEIGLTLRHFFKNIWLGFAGYVAILPLLLLVLFVLAALAQVFKYEPKPQPVVEIYLMETKEHFLVFFTFFVAIVGPVIEEIFFRGFTYKAFRARYGIRWAVIGSALIFAALHMNVMAFVPIFTLGIFLAYLYEKTGSLVPCMTVHVLHNLIMVSLTLGFKSLSV